MYRCQKCHVVVGPRIPVHRQIAEVRPQTYTFTRVNEDEEEEVVTTHGTEIVKEVICCPACAKGLDPSKGSLS